LDSFELLDCIDLVHFMYSSVSNSYLGGQTRRLSEGLAKKREKNTPYFLFLSSGNQLQLVYIYNNK